MCHLWDALIKSYDAHPYTAHRKAHPLKAYIQQNFGLRLVRGMELPPTTPSHMWIYSCPGTVHSQRARRKIMWNPINAKTVK